MISKLHACKFETVIGLEVHVELATKTKIFCSCSTEYGAPYNANTCPICLGFPGVLPSLNGKAVIYALKAALALNCNIAQKSKFDRKNYYYPDLPKGYQISQYDKPLGKDGYVDIFLENFTKRIGILRLHLEEDAGKLIHLENETLIDFNRAGVPLIEIVSKPELNSAFEAKAYLEKLKLILKYIGVSDVKMEEGSLRCDANISVRPLGQKEFGVKTEIKNLNSFKNVEKALLFEENRQKQLLLEGKPVLQQTLRWLEDKNETVALRSKEEAHDYRYFEEPDLVWLTFSASQIADLAKEIPKLPDERLKQYLDSFGLSFYDAKILISSKELADYFEGIVAKGADPKITANILISDFLGLMKKFDISFKDLFISKEDMFFLIKLLEKKTLSFSAAKVVLKEMVTTKKKPSFIIEEKGLNQLSDVSVLKAEVEKVLENNRELVEEFRNGKEKVLGFLIGQVMKATKGKANPSIVNNLLREKLKN